MKSGTAAASSHYRMHRSASGQGDVVSCCSQIPRMDDPTSDAMVTSQLNKFPSGTASGPALLVIVCRLAVFTTILPELQC